MQREGKLGRTNAPLNEPPQGEHSVCAKLFLGLGPSWVRGPQVTGEEGSHLLCRWRMVHRPG